MKYQNICFSIDASLADIRLDRALASHPDIRTRTRAAKLLQQGLVTLAGQIVKASHLTHSGDQFAVQIPIENDTSTVEPLALDLNIVYEDDVLIVVNKPAGLVMHPAVGHSQDTLVNALIHHTNQLSQGFGERRPGIVHRLDKDTSGLLVIAKNDRAHEHLAEQFRSRQVHRLYWAIVFGHPRSPAGQMVSRLLRHPQDRKRFASVRGESTQGKRAVTNYQVLRTVANGLALLQLKLETGRTHQIRVHLSEMSHPIVGDSLYGGNKRTSSLKSIGLRKLIEDLPRFALHATELGFQHPTRQEWLSFHADWPEDLLPLVHSCEFAP